MLDNTSAELTLKNDKLSQRRMSDDCNPMESDHVWKRSECWKSWKSTQFLTSESRRRLTGEPSCKFLCTSYHLHVWGGCLGCGRTTERSAHHTAPSTLPTQTMMTIHSGLKCDKTDSSDFTAVCVCTRQLWIWLQRLTGAVRVGLTPLRPSSLAHTNLTVHFDLLARPVAHTRHLTHTLLWWHTLLCVAHHLPLWTPASWKYWYVREKKACDWNLNWWRSHILFITQDIPHVSWDAPTWEAGCAGITGGLTADVGTGQWAGSTAVSNQACGTAGVVTSIIQTWFYSEAQRQSRKSYCKKSCVTKWKVSKILVRYLFLYAG